MPQALPLFIYEGLTWGRAIIGFSLNSLTLGARGTANHTHLSPIIPPPLSHCPPPPSPSWNGRFMQTALCAHFPARICRGHMSSAQIIKLIINWDWRKQVVSSPPTWLWSQLSECHALARWSTHITGQIIWSSKMNDFPRGKPWAGKRPRECYS